MANRVNDPNDKALLAGFLAMATRVFVAFPLATLALGVALAVYSGAISLRKLEYHTTRLDLIDPQNGYNQLWIEYIEEFGAEDDAVVVVEGPNRNSVVAALQDLSESLVRYPHLFHAVLHEIDLSVVRSKGLHYLPSKDLLGIESFLQEIDPILQDNWSELNVQNMLTTDAQRLTLLQRESAPGVPAEQMANYRQLVESELQRLCAGLASALESKGNYESPWPHMSQGFATLSELGSRFLLTNDGKLGFALLRLAEGEESTFTRNTKSIGQLRNLIRQTAAEHSDVEIGLTGLPVMEHDEMRMSQREMTFATILGLLGVLCMFLAGFGSLRHSLIAVGVLSLGMIWSCGYLTLVVGHMNILSSAFAVVLIGLGINYPIHYIARYLQLRGEQPDETETLPETARSVGPGIITGAVTTSLAFFAAGLTEFRGVAELGIIAGGGILLCMLASLTVLPAVIRMVDRSLGKSVHVPQPLRVDRWLAPLLRIPKTVLFCTLLFTAFTCLGYPRLWYDHNLLNLQAAGLESVELEHRLLTEYGQSVWFALSIADTREELLERKKQFMSLSTVERTEEIVSLLPVDHEQKQPIIDHIHSSLENLPERAPMIPVTPPEILGRTLGSLQQSLAVTEPNNPLVRQFAELRDTLRKLPVAECYQRLDNYQQQMAGDLLSRLHLLRGVSNPAPPTLTDLPDGLVTRFVGSGGKHLLKIYARDNTWDMDALKQFVLDVRSVDPRVTGNPLQTYEASLTMQQSYLLAALYSLIGITVAIYIDFRHIGHTLLALIPLLLSIAQTFGLLGILNIPLNPANMIALPLLIGLGVEDGVHIVHDFRSQRRRRYRLTPSVALAVVLTSVTTVASFASMMTAGHRGLYSLGRVMTLGVMCCLVTSLVMLPALLNILTRSRELATSDKKDRKPSLSAPSPQSVT